MAAKTETFRSSDYKLGRVCFAIENCDQAFVDDLEVLLPLAGEHSEPVREIKMGCVTDIRGLLNTIFKHHLGCFWIDAGCLVSPTGKRLLIVGQSSVGKSTTTMALALGHGWKVAAEDVMLIDLDRDEVLPFASPFSLKAGTAEMLFKTIGRYPEPILQGEWFPLNQVAVQQSFDAKFDLAILLLPRNPEEPELQITEISPAEYLRGILRLSNVLRCKDASEKMIGYLSSGQCIQMKGGTLQERLDAIFERCG